MEGINNKEEWFTKWHEAGQLWEKRAEQAKSKGCLVTAKEAYSQAAFFYRAAEFYLPEKDKRKVPTYMKNNSCFENAGRYFNPPLNRVEIPYEGTTLPGYLYLPAKLNGRVPAVLFLGGADDCKEELHYTGVTDIVQRGLACLICDTPGRGEVLRVQGLRTRPDFEVVVSAALDFLERQPEIDSEKIGILGVSMGGYYAPRGAAFDSRVKACVSWTGLYDVGVGLFDYFPPIQEQLGYILGAKDLEEARDKLKQFTLRDCIKQISCPYLIVHGGKDILIPASQAEQVYREADCPKELKIWPEGLHVCNNFLPEVRACIFDWLTEKLA